MAWENFWKLDPTGRRITTGPQLAAFRTHFPDRVVEPKGEIHRPLMMVLEKPYKLARLPMGEGYEHAPVHLRDIQGWPPKLSLSRFGHLPRQGEGDLVDAKVVPAAKVGGETLLLIRGDFDNQEASCAIGGYPPILLDCIARTLNEHRGEAFRSMSDCEIRGVD